ncbi:hypothetical protein BY996DRAFT_6423092 [Phakopsora pachyrhizi]|nr:hypothetical protein BY996DRAFT_6423092 [Phakopsora pachyrhizi]
MYRLYGSEMISCGLERPERLEEMGMRAKYPIVLGRMEEISAEAKLLIGLCYKICFLVKELRQLVAVGSPPCAWGGGMCQAEMTEWEEGPDQGSDRKSLTPCGTIRRGAKQYAVQGMA